MTFVQQAFASDTLAADLDAAAVTGTLTTGNFGTPTGEQMLVVDYDNSKREIIKCAIDGTGLTSIDRGQDGTSDVDHTAGAKVIMAFVPSHYGDLGKIAAADAWTDWTPTATGFSGAIDTTGSSYIKIGKTVHLYGYVDGTSNATTLTITNLPYAAKRTIFGVCGSTKDNSSYPAASATFLILAGSTTATFYLSNVKTSTSWTASNNKIVGFNLTYESE